MSTDNMLRCRPLKPCPQQDRCARFIRAIPFGGGALDFSQGPQGCNGRFVPLVSADPIVPQRTHDNPGWKL